MKTIVLLGFDLQYEGSRLATGKIITSLLNSYPSYKVILINCPSVTHFTTYDEAGKDDVRDNMWIAWQHAMELEVKIALRIREIVDNRNLLIKNVANETDPSSVQARMDFISPLDDRSLEGLSVGSTKLGEAFYVDLSLCRKRSSLESASDRNFAKGTLLNGLLALEQLLFLQNSSGSIVFHLNLYSANFLIYKFLGNEMPEVRQRMMTFLHEDASLKNLSVNVCESNFHDQIDRSVLGRALSDQNRFLREAVDFAIKHISFHVIGNSPWKYSPDVEFSVPTLRGELNADGKPLIVYYSSSPDEEVAGKQWLNLHTGITDFRPQLPFESEIDCIRFLASAASRLGAKLAIRLHPRLAEDQRVKRISSSYLVLVDECEAIGREFDGSVVTIRPESRISSYTIGYMASVCFTHRSSMGQVLPLLGVPCYFMSDNNGFKLPLYNNYLSTREEAVAKLTGSNEREALGIDIESYLIGFYLSTKAGYKSPNEVAREMIGQGSSFRDFVYKAVYGSTLTQTDPNTNTLLEYSRFLDIVKSRLLIF